MITSQAQAVQDSKFIVCDRDGSRATKTVYATRKAATKAADRLDNIYGGYRYSVKAL